MCNLTHRAWISAWVRVKVTHGKALRGHSDISVTLGPLFRNAGIVAGLEGPEHALTSSL